MDVILCKGCSDEIDYYNECHACGCLLCEFCTVILPDREGEMNNYCDECARCPVCGERREVYDAFRCDCGARPCPECRQACGRCGEMLCQDCIETHECGGD